MTQFFTGIRVVLSLELRQRVRGTAWYVLLGLFFGLLAIVTVLLTWALTGFGENDSAGGGIYSTIIYFVLLLGTLVTPALSGNAINGDRDAGTLATTQVTRLGSWQIVLGKFLAAWISAIAFLLVALPFIIYASAMGGLEGGTILVSTVILALELGVVSAVGVGLSGMISRPLFSVVATYLVVAALSIGTLIAFTLGGMVARTTVTTTSSYGTVYTESGRATECAAPVVQTYENPSFDRFWGVLVANPYVLLADAVPTQFDEYGNPSDLFGTIKMAVRSAQIAPPTEVVRDECNPQNNTESGYLGGRENAEELIASTTPGWFVGLLIQFVLAAGLLLGAWSRTRTPARQLPKGSRIA